MAIVFILNPPRVQLEQTFASRPAAREINLSETVSDPVLAQIGVTADLAVSGYSSIDNWSSLRNRMP